MQPWIDNIQSPSQIMPAFDLLNELQGPASERQMLIGAFERAINRNFGDDRSFSRAFYRDRYMGLRLISGLEESGEASRLSPLARLSRQERRRPERSRQQTGNKAILPSTVNSLIRCFPNRKRFKLEDFESVSIVSPKDKLYLNSPTYNESEPSFQDRSDAKNHAENREDKEGKLEWQTK